MLADKCILDEVEFHGHPNVLGEHKNTIEITKETSLSKRGDCIIGVRASKGCATLNRNLKNHIKSSKAMRFEISVEEQMYSFVGFGSTELELSDPHEIVLRKSYYSSPRTAAIRCNAAAVDIPRIMIAKLRDPGTTGLLRIYYAEYPQEIPTPIDFVG